MPSPPTTPCAGRISCKRDDAVKHHTKHTKSTSHAPILKPVHSPRAIDANLSSSSNTSAITKHEISTKLHQSASASSSSSRPTLHLNRLSDVSLHARLLALPGIGRVSTRRILTARTMGGDFTDAQNFDARVHGVTYARLLRIVKQSGQFLSIAPRRPNLRKKTIISTKDMHISQHVDASTRRRKLLTLVTWNAAHLGTTTLSKHVALQRLVIDADADIVCVQESSGNEAAVVAAKRLGQDWQVGCSKNGDSSLIIFYHSKRVSVLAIKLRVSHGSFVRRPQIYFVKTHSMQFVLVHVHLRQSAPDEEMIATGRLVRRLQRRGYGKVVVMGDFNLEADDMGCQALREAGLVEVVRPPRGGVGDGLNMVCEATTVGGTAVDNVWMERDLRERVDDAWTFAFGGRGKALRQSGHSFAAARRARESDHLAVVVSVDSSVET